jgi:hypothetical protein
VLFNLPKKVVLPHAPAAHTVGGGRAHGYTSGGRLLLPQPCLLRHKCLALLLLYQRLLLRHSQLAVYRRGAQMRRLAGGLPAPLRRRRRML